MCSSCTVQYVATCTDLARASERREEFDLLLSLHHSIRFDSIRFDSIRFDSMIHSIEYLSLARASRANLAFQHGENRNAMPREDEPDSYY